MNRSAIIVDPYSGAREYATALRARGIRPIALLSTAAPLEGYLATWVPADFDAVHAYAGDFDELVTTVKGYDPIAIIPGNEAAVELTDALTAVFHPAVGNTPETSAARRDKWHMAQALERSGVPHVQQICSADEDEVAAWIERSGLSGRPLVIKPPKSGGTDDVYLVKAGEDWRPYFRRLLGTVNRFDLRNDTLLVQEFADGPEYIVDSYSVDGQFGLVDVCRYRKHNRDDRVGIYDGAEYLPPDDPTVRILGEYTRQVAEAVGLRNGCGHSEVIMTADGPRLVEIGARPAGSCLNTSGRLGTGDCHIDRTLRHMLDGEFTPGYALRQEIRVAWLSAPNPGILRNAEVMDAVRDLPSAHDMRLARRTGDTVPATDDLFTSLGWVILASPSRAQVESDYARVHELAASLVIDAGSSNGKTHA